MLGPGAGSSARKTGAVRRTPSEDGLGLPVSTLAGGGGAPARLRRRWPPASRGLVRGRAVPAS